MPDNCAYRRLYVGAVQAGGVLLLGGAAGRSALCNNAGGIVARCRFGRHRIDGDAGGYVFHEGAPTRNYCFSGGRDSGAGVCAGIRIGAHVQHTGSPKGRRILAAFGEYLPRFKKIIPNDYKRLVQLASQFEEQGVAPEQAQIEAFYASLARK